MAEKHFDPEDPFTLNGHAVALTAAEAEEHTLEMIDTIIHEFAMLGWPREMILGMFKKPFYRMPYMICREKGEGFIRDRVNRFFGTRVLISLEDKNCNETCQSGQNPP